MFGAFYTLLILLGTALIWAFLSPSVITLVSLPGTLVYLGLRETNTARALGFILAFIGQTYIVATISAWTVALTYHMIRVKNAWELAVWPMAFFGALVMQSAGGREARQSSEEFPELRKHPMYMAFWCSLIPGIIAFIIFAVHPEAYHPLWSWIPWVE